MTLPMRRALALMALVALSMIPPMAVAQPLAAVRLRATRALGAERCPTEDLLRDAVRARLGGDPFADSASARVEVSFARSHHGLRAELRVAAPDVDLVAPRVIRSRRRDCRALAEAAALAVSLVIAELAPRDPPPAPAPAPATPPASIELVAPVVASSRASEPRVTTMSAELPRAVVAPPAAPTARWEVHLDALGAWGITPSLTGGLSLGGSWRRGALSLGVDVRGVLPGVERVARGGVEVTTFAASSAVCLHGGLFAACGVVNLGAVVGEGRDAAITHRVSTPSVRAGVRLAVTSSNRPGIALRAWAEADAPMTVTEHAVDNAVVWTTPVLAVALGVGVGVRLP